MRLPWAEREVKSLLDVTQEQNRRLLNFAHIVSHNLRSHASNFEMILNYMLEDQSDTEFMVESLKKNARSLSETVLHLDAVVNIHAGIEELEEKVMLIEVLQNALNALNADIQRHRVEVDVEEFDAAMAAKGKRAYFDSIFINLLSNAIKYRKPDAPAQIRVKGKQNASGISISFSDNGLGIDLAKHGNKVFGMYKTFHGNKDAKGIGLFITQNQVQAMGGSIEVESANGKGTTFHLHFPAYS